MIAIPLPLLPPSSSPHLLLRRFLRPFPPLLRPISTATSPHFHPILTTATLPSFSSPSRSIHSTSLLPHSLSTSHHPLNDVVSATDNSHIEAEYEDKVEDSEAENESNNLKDNVLAVNDVVLEEEIDNSDSEAQVEDSDDEDNLKMNMDVGLEEETDDFEFEAEDEVEKVSDNSSKKKVLGVNAKAGPIMSIKEKKELASYAHSLGKELRSQQVGKSGVTDTVITALIETLEKRELLKLKIHANCPAELDDAIKQIEMGTGSVAVSQIGRTVILYRPSISKLQAEQKKKEVRRKLMKKRPAWVRSSSQSEELSKLTARGRRGSSRV